MSPTYTLYVLVTMLLTSISLILACHDGQHYFTWDNPRFLSIQRSKRIGETKQDWLVMFASLKQWFVKGLSLFRERSQPFSARLFLKIPWIIRVSRQRGYIVRSYSTAGRFNRALQIYHQCPGNNSQCDLVPCYYLQFLTSIRLLSEMQANVQNYSHSNIVTNLQIGNGLHFLN
jgi:hypothetical protein